MRRITVGAAAAFLVCAALASCYRPIFDDRISAGALFANHLGSPFRTIGPVGMNNDITGGEFVPERNFDPYNGFWVQYQSGSVDVEFIKYSGGTYALSSATTNMPTDGGNLSFAHSAYFTASQQILLGTGTGSSTTGMTMETFTAGSPDAFAPGSPYAPANSSAPPSIFGLGATQVAGSDTDTIAVIYLNVSGQLSATSYTSTASALTETVGDESTLQVGASGPNSIGRAFIGADGGGYALYYYGGGQVLRWTWTGTGASGSPATISVQDPLVAVLSNGILVCQGRDYLSGYRPDGSRIFSTPAGSVQFVHEVDYSGTDYCIFAQTLVAPNNQNGNSSVYIELWRLPTAAFEGLGN
ncbi:MAG: hypothetical protein ACLQMF_01710 [Rectinemataceae bacterium]